MTHCSERSGPQLRRKGTGLNELREYRLELSGMTCGACERIIEKVAARNSAQVGEMDPKKGRVTILAEESKISEIKEELAKRGFPEKSASAGPERGSARNVLNYIKAVLSVDDGVEEEARLINHAIASTIILAALNAGIYIFFMQGLEGASKYVPLLVLGIAASIVTAFAYLHSKCYRKEISCQNGMMVGMTMGMMPGFMAGAIIAATNGMFMGSIVGLAAGIGIGVKSGKCCGVMGAMEGIMAGLMAGIMGPMTVIMTLNDNMLALLYIVFAACIFLLLGLSYMLYREEGEMPQKSARLTEFIVISAAFNIALIAIMLIGPKGPLRFV